MLPDVTGLIQGAEFLLSTCLGDFIFKANKEHYFVCLMENPPEELAMLQIGSIAVLLKALEDPYFIRDAIERGDMVRQT